MIIRHKTKEEAGDSRYKGTRSCTLEDARRIRKMRYRIKDGLFKVSVNLCGLAQTRFHPLA